MSIKAFRSTPNPLRFLNLNHILLSIRFSIFKMNHESNNWLQRSGVSLETNLQIRHPTNETNSTKNSLNSFKEIRFKVLLGSKSSKSRPSRPSRFCKSCKLRAEGEGAEPNGVLRGYSLWLKKKIINTEFYRAKLKIISTNLRKL